MVKVNNETIILIAGIVLGIIILKFLGKSLFRVIGLIVMIIIGLIYSYFFTNFFVEHKESKVVQKVEQKMEQKMPFLSIVKYQKKHCQGIIQTKNDSITCECIVSPLVNDMINRLSAEKLDSLDTNKQLYLKELMISLKHTEKDILFNLKERKAVYLWNKMVLNLREGKVIGEE